MDLSNDQSNLENAQFLLSNLTNTNSLSSILLTFPEFTTYMTDLLKTKFPGYQFDDIDHYAGSLVVETTVSTSSATKSGQYHRLYKVINA